MEQPDRSRRDRYEQPFTTHLVLASVSYTRTQHKARSTTEHEVQITIEHCTMKKQGLLIGEGARHY